MTTAPPARNGARKHKASALTSWLRKSTASDDADAKKLASPAEEIKMVFLRQLKLSSFDLDGKHYHSVFTGAQIVDIILEHFKLPDRKLATNVASRLVDCSLYTHVSGPSFAGGARPAGAEVLDSTAEIYTLTAEAETAMRSIRSSSSSSSGGGGDSGLSRAKTQTRKRVQELRSHLHPRPESHSARSTGSTHSATMTTTGAARTQSAVSSSSKESAASHPRRVHPSPSLPAPLDMRRAREAATGQLQGRDNHRRSVADSILSDFTTATTPSSIRRPTRRSPDSPADTLVSQGPAPAHGPASAPLQGTPMALDSPSTADDHCTAVPLLLQRSSACLASQLEGVDIPTGCLDGLPNTWSYVVDPSATGSHSRPVCSSDPTPCGGTPGRRLCRAGPDRSSVGPAESTASGGADDDDDSSARRESHPASAEWLERGSVLSRFGSEAGGGAASAQRLHNHAPRASCFSDYTVTRYSSMPSISEQLAGGRGHAAAAEDGAQQQPRAGDEEWLAELLSASQSASRFSAAMTDGPYGRSMHSLAGSHVTGDSVPFESTVHLNMAFDGARRHPRGRRHSIGTQADVPIFASHSGGSSRLLTPVTLRSSIAATTTAASDHAGPGGDRASRSSMYLAMLADAFSAGDRDSAGAARFSAPMLVQSSIPNFPRPPLHCGSPYGDGDDAGSAMGGGSEMPQASALPVPLSADSVAAWDARRQGPDGPAPRSLRELPAGSKRLSRNHPGRGTVLVRRQITPDRSSTASTQSHLAGDSSESAAEAASSEDRQGAPKQLGRDDGESGERAGGVVCKRISRNLQLQLWRDTVPGDVLRALTHETVARQEAIHEVICTEQGYLRDLELIDPVFVAPLLASPTVMAPGQAGEFVHMLFFNYQCLVANSRQLCARLTARQALGAVVQHIGDIFDEWADSLSVFVEYAVHVPVAQCELEAELLRNERLAQFLLDAEAAPKARRLPIQSFLGRPAARLARYPLLLNAVIKRSPADGDEARRLQSAVAKVRRALTEIDRRTGEAAGALRMRHISQRLRLVRGARESLALDSPARQLVNEGVLYLPDGQQVLVFLFDNSLIMAVEERVPYAKSISRYAADERIIPISMLDVHLPPAESGPLMGIRGALGLPSSAGRLARESSSATSMRGWAAATAGSGSGSGGGGGGGSAGGAGAGGGSGSGGASAPPAIAGAAGRQPLTFVHIGCRALSRTLLAGSDAERAQWAAAVGQRICVPQTLVEAYTDLRMLSDRDFAQGRVPQCSAPFVSILSGCQMVLFGNKDGLHMGIYGVPTSVVRVSNASNVTKIHIMKRYNMAVVLSDANLLVFALSEIEKATAQIGVGVVGTRIASSVAFFDVGTYMGAPLVVLMKVRGGKSHFKCIQPLPNPDEPPAAAEPGAASPSASIKSDDDNVASSASSSTRHARRRETISEPPPAAPATEAGAPQRVVYQGPDAQLRLIGEFVVAGKTKRVHFLRRKLCIVGARSFEIVDVQQGRVLRSLPDPLDDDFSFLHALDCGQAMAICKVGREFLLCYEAFAFFIDNFGRRSRLDVFIRWEMRPQLITFRHPYIVAVNPRFIEVRHIETGVLLSIIRIRGALCLNPDSRSTILHLAIGPEPQGIPAPAPAATASPQPQQAGPVPLPSEPETPRPLSVAAAALAKPAAAALAAGHVVPGIAGTTGKSLFPEAIPGHYRIVEVRLPPLKPSAKSATPAS